MFLASPRILIVAKLCEDYYKVKYEQISVFKQDIFFISFVRTPNNATLYLTLGRALQSRKSDFLKFEANDKIGKMSSGEATIKIVHFLNIKNAPIK